MLTKVGLPLSTASIATITLFQMVGYWNDWFAATIYQRQPQVAAADSSAPDAESIDISTFGAEAIRQLRMLSNRSFKAAMIIFATIPVLCVYLFMQKHFVAGITIGSIKE